MAPVSPTSASQAGEFCSRALLRCVEEQRLRLDALQEEAAALRDCLEEAGVLSSVRYMARLHRRHFEAARAAHPSGSERPLSFSDVVTTGSVAFTLGTLIGPMQAKTLRPTGTAVGRAAGDVLPRLRAMFPGHVYVHGGYDGQRRLLSIERLAPSGDAWELLPPMAERRAVVTAAATPGELYVCGGWDGEQRMSLVERYNIGQGTWEAVPPMLERRSHPAVATFGGRLYVCGGFDGAESLSSVECFDPATGRWGLLPPMLERRRRAVAVVMREQLYVCGGFDGAGQLNFAERFDCTAHRASAAGGGEDAEAGREGAAWAPLPPMLSRRVVNAAAVIDGRLYVFGSEDDARVVSSAERFDPTLDRWEALPPMLSRRVGAAAAAAAGCLYVCGGWDGRARLSSVERFNPRLGAWEELAPMLHRRDRAAVATIAGKLYVCGGFDGDRDLSSAEIFDPVRGTWTALPEMWERRSSAVAISSIA